MWIYIIILVVFFVIVVLKLIHFAVKKKGLQKFKDLNAYKKRLDIKYEKIPDNREVIYYSNGPLNIYFDPSNQNIYKGSTIDLPVYMANDEKAKKVGTGWLYLYIFIAILSFIVMALSIACFTANKIDESLLSFMNYDWLETVKNILINEYFLVSIVLFFLLTILFIAFNVAYRKLFIFFVPIYVDTINNQNFVKAMQPIYIKLN